MTNSEPLKPFDGDVNKHVGEECPRCLCVKLEDDLCGNAVCNFDYLGSRCGFSTEGLDE